MILSSSGEDCFVPCVCHVSCPSNEIKHLGKSNKSEGTTATESILFDFLDIFTRNDRHEGV